MKIILYKLRSNQIIEIFPDKSLDSDGWFIRINYVEKKSNKLKLTKIIIEKDLDQWINFLKRNGWMLKTQNQ